MDGADVVGRLPPLRYGTEGPGAQTETSRGIVSRVEGGSKKNIRLTRNLLAIGIGIVYTMHMNTIRTRLYF